MRSRTRRSRRRACARAGLLLTLQNWAKVSGKTKASAARLLGNTQPLISDLMRGKIGPFPLQALIDMASIAGLEPHITLKKQKSSCEQRETELAAT